MGGAILISVAIYVAVVEDKRDIRESLRILIDGSPGFHTAGVYGSMEEALSGPLEPAPQVALMDIGLPGMSGTEGIPLLKQRYPGLAPLVLSVYDDDERIFAALCAGAVGYLLKKTPPARLLEGIREAVDGGAPMTPEIARRVVALFQRVRPPEKADWSLTPNERRLLKLMIDGESYKSAAAAMGVTMSTISFHTRNIYEKLQVHSKSEAVAKALRSGFAD